MKKFLSCILIVAVLMSVLCSISTIVTAENVNSWPYYFEDFEDGDCTGLGTGSPTAYVDGANGSAKAAKYSTSGNAIDLIIPSMSGELKSGSKIYISMDLKLDAAISGDKLDFYFHYLSEANSAPGINTGVAANGFATMYETGERPKLSFDNDSTEWQHVENMWTYKGQDVIINGSWYTKINLASSGGATITYDNIEIKIIRESLDNEELKKDIYSNDFSNGSMSGINAYTASHSGKFSVVNVADGVTGSSDKVLQVNDDLNNARVDIKLVPNESIYYNTEYILTYDTRIVSAMKSDGTVLGSSQGSSSRWYVNGTYLLLSVPCDNNWYHMRYVFKVAGTPGMKVADDMVLQWWLTAQSGGDTALYQFDNIKLTVAEGFENGDFEVNNADFESSRTKVVTPETTNATTWFNTYYGFKSETGAAVSMNVEGAEYSNDASKAALFSYTDLNAKIYDAVSLNPGSKYRIKGYTKASSDTSAGPVQIGVDWDDGTAGAIITTVKNNKAQDWKQVDATFAVPANCTGKGKIWIKHLEAEAGDETQDTSAGTISFYTDNWTIEKMPSDNVPTVSATATISIDGVVTILSTNENLESTTVTNIIKLVAKKNSTKTYIGTTKSSTITVPENYKNGYELYIDIMPLSSDGYVGEVKSVEIKNEKDVTNELNAPVGNVYSSTAKIENNISSGTATNAVLILVLYDSDNRIIASDSEAVKCQSGIDTSGDVTVSVTKPSDKTVSYYISFLLDCGDEPSPDEFNTNLTEIISEDDSRNQ